MQETTFQLLEKKIDELITTCARLRQQNESLMAKQENWQMERKLLLRKNDLIRNKIEAMIMRLKELETDKT